MQYTKKNITLIDGKHHLHLDDATFFKREDGRVNFFKIEGTKVFVQGDKVAFDQSTGSAELVWLATLIDPDEIIHSPDDEYVPLPMVGKPEEKIAEKIDATIQSPTKEPDLLIAHPWKDHPVHKEDRTKIPVHLCPPAAIEGIALTLQASIRDKKRESWNWRKGQIDLMGYLGKTLRHIHKVIDRVNEGDIDPETRTHHLECALADLAIIMDAKRHGTLADNRPHSIFSNTGS